MTSCCMAMYMPTIVKIKLAQLQPFLDSYLYYVHSLRHTLGTGKSGLSVGATSVASPIIFSSETFEISANNSTLFYASSAMCATSTFTGTFSSSGCSLSNTCKTNGYTTLTAVSEIKTCSQKLTKYSTCDPKNAKYISGLSHECTLTLGNLRYLTR